MKQFGLYLKYLCSYCIDFVPNISSEYRLIFIEISLTGMQWLATLNVHRLLTIGKSILRFLSITKDIGDKSLVQHFMASTGRARSCAARAARAVIALDSSAWQAPQQHMQGDIG